MNVLYITHYAGLYGANKSMLALLEDLRIRYNVGAKVLCLGEGPLIEECRNKNIDISVCQYYTWMTPENNANKALKNTLKKILNPLLIQKTYKIIREYNFDLIYCNSSIQDLGIKIALDLKKPIVWHLREFGEKDYSVKCIYSDKYRENLFKKANCLIAISNAIESYYRTISPDANIKKIYNGVKAFDRILHINENEIEIVQFCCVGAINDCKNQMEILEASKKLIENGITKFKINFIGEGEEYEEQLKEYVKSNNMEDYVDFLGYRSDIQNILQNMHVGIMSSKNEAFGRVTVEYMFAEMPVIGTNSGGTPEIIEHEITGYLYSSGDPIALSEYMKYYIFDKKSIVKMGVAGRKRALDNFSVKSNTDKIYEQFKNCLEG